MQMVKQRRFAFPHPNLSQAQIEPIRQPLYSMVVIDNAVAIPNITQAFKYAEGGTIAGLAAAAGTVTGATKLNTNMETPGFIASPKVFLITGVRFYISPLNSILDEPLEIATDSSTQTPVAGHITDFLEVLYGTTFTLRVGNKDYLTVPSWMVPANVGTKGIVAVALSTDNAGTDGPEQTVLSSYCTSGQYFSMGEHRILIPSQQNFHTTLGAPQATSPTVAGAVLEMAVYHILDGVLGREVQ